MSDVSEFVKDEKMDSSQLAQEQAATSKKRPASNKKLNHYNRLKILECLIEKGCDSRNCSAVSRKFKVDPGVIEEYANERARSAQDNVHEECDSICFQNINSWLAYFKEMGYNKEANLETGMLMIALADTESHPAPRESGGVNFQRIYRFLGDVMLGNPTPELNRESKVFLGREFENLIDEANSSQGDEDARTLQLSIENASKQISPLLSYAARKRRRDFGSLDPMSIDKLLSGSTRERNAI